MKSMNRFFRELNKLERLMRCPGEFVIEPHSVASHSFKVAHYMQLLGEIEAASGANVDWKALYEKALNHDVEETQTGDIKSNVKNADPAMLSIVRQVAHTMMSSFVETSIPEEVRHVYEQKLLVEHKDETLEGRLLQVADKLDQLYESATEIHRGNTDPVHASIYQNALRSIAKHYSLPSVQYLIDVVVPDIVRDNANVVVNLEELTAATLGSLTLR